MLGVLGLQVSVFVPARSCGRLNLLMRFIGGRWHTDLSNQLRHLPNSSFAGTLLVSIIAAYSSILIGSLNLQDESLMHYLRLLAGDYLPR